VYQVSIFALSTFLVQSNVSTSAFEKRSQKDISENKAHL